MLFADRDAAGRALAEQVARHLHDDQTPPLVLALPRGGVPVADQVARVIGAELDVVVARKIGLPGHPEYGVGAVTAEGPAIFHQSVLARAGLTENDLTEAIARERAEAHRRLRQYRGDRPGPRIEGRTVIVVDDGLATGVTAIAALREVRRHSPSHLVFAAPVCARDASERLAREADAVICAEIPRRFWAVGEWYTDFAQLTDDDVKSILARESTEDVRVPIDGDYLFATVRRPPDPAGVVLFAHGSGSSRHSPRNRMVAERLNRSGFTTVLLDLLTPAESEVDDRTAQWRFDIPLLAGRLVTAIDWLGGSLPIGLFGASTGAAAALVAAARRPDAVRAVVSRGGRPDLAGEALRQVSAPTLLIVGGEDEVVIGLNESAAEVLGDKAELAVVPGAGHLFTEPGALERVADLAGEWFTLHLNKRLVGSASTR